MTLNIRLMLILAFLLILGGCQSGGAIETSTTAAPASASQSESDLLPPDTKRVVLHVEGLSCPLCATNIEKELNELPSAGKVTVDLATGRVVVPLEGGLLPTRSQLRRLVVDSGFSLRSIEVQ